MNKTTKSKQLLTQKKSNQNHQQQQTSSLSLDVITNIFQAFLHNSPTPKTELDYINDYTLLVAIILSAQATDISVNKATKDLFAIVATPEEMLYLGIEKLKQYIKTIGLFNSKAKNILAMSNSLILEHNSKVPTDFSSLIELSGVGRKTANVFLNCAYGKKVIAVDTHVQRVANRIGLCNTTKPDDTEKNLMQIIPDEFLLYAHHWLILHGRYICKARKPDCNICQINQYCRYYNEQ
jgi:endonuclease III